MLRIACFWIIIFYLRFWQTLAKHDLTLNESKAIIQRILELKDELNELASPYVKITITDVPANCVQMQCKFICFNGKSNEIEKDIKRVLGNSRIDCEFLEELRIYNYDFPNNIIPKNFLGDFHNKTQSLYIATSTVTDIEDGAFGNGIFQKLAFENLQLKELRRNFFVNISSDFYSLSIVQTDPPLQSICQGFLDIVQAQIQYLSLQVGITCVRNMTASNILLSNLAHVDYSYNDLSSELTSNTFGMLSMVEHLDLSHSKIVALPNYIFFNIVKTLAFLDISHNELKTISSHIFGWQKVRSDLKIYANHNKWDCSCELHKEMKALYGDELSNIYCATPEEYKNWSVFDIRLCEESTGEYISTTTMNTFISTTTTTTGSAAGADGKSTPYNPSTTVSTPQPDNDDVQLVCRNQVNIFEKIALKVKPPVMEFSVTTQPKLRVEVLLKVTSLLEGEHGLIWFNKVTKEYYNMEINYKDYGLGCYGAISYLTIVEDLTPNIAYTFCLVQKNQPAISPFNCKSVHIPGNLNVRYAWITRDLRTTGISLTVLGVVLCTFIGILVAFLILKQRPILLKGSKRIATTKGNGNEIVVLPKDRSLDELRIKEEMLAKRVSKSNISYTHQRVGSIVSTASYQSYMNTNLYEELPAYIKLDADTIASSDSDYNYIPPLRTDSSKAHLVSYAEIPFRHKRTSNDPLPEVPKDEVYMDPTKMDATDILKHDFELSTGYAFAYDCDV